MRRLSADMHRGQRASLGNQTDHAIKAGYKRAADFFATRHKFLLLPGRHPYKMARTIWAVTAKEQSYQRGFQSVRPNASVQMAQAKRIKFINQPLKGYGQSL